MSDFRHDSAGNVYQIALGYKVHLSGDYFYGVLAGTLAGNPNPGLVISYQADDAKLAAIPDLPNLGSGPVVNIPTKFTITGTADAVV